MATIPPATTKTDAIPAIKAAAPKPPVRVTRAPNAKDIAPKDNIDNPAPRVHFNVGLSILLGNNLKIQEVATIDNAIKGIANDPANISFKLYLPKTKIIPANGTNDNPIDKLSTISFPGSTNGTKD